jgi:hypothetical protein
MNDVSLFRLNLLRAVYLLIGVGLALNIWPQLGRPQELMHGVVNCMLAVVAVLALAGVRHPLRMLPILLWEMLWKALWVLLVALPAWRAGTMDEGIAATLFACAVGVVVPLTLPWTYVWRRYVTDRAEPWRRAKAPAPGAHAVQ